MREEIYSSFMMMDLKQGEEDEESLNLSDYIIEIPFASSLVHLGKGTLYANRGDGWWAGIWW